jgi:hypothetical protein
LLYCCCPQFELLAYGNCWGSVANLRINGALGHFPIYSTNYDSSGKK